MRPATASVLAQTALTAGMPDWQIEQFLADLVGAGPAAHGLDRRTFLKVLGLGTAGVAAALWVPGQKTVFVPDRTLIEARTLAEALSQGLIAVFPDGTRLTVQIGGGGDGRTLEQRVQAECAAIAQMGGRVIENRQYRRHRP